jgi:hypothetical protein
MKSSLHMSRRLRPNVSPEKGRDARARAWIFIFQCWQEKQMTIEPAAEPHGCNEVSIRNRKEVSHVEQRYDRSSQIT